MLTDRGMLHFPSIKGGEATNKFRISICIWNKTKCIYDINHHWVMLSLLWLDLRIFYLIHTEIVHTYLFVILICFAFKASKEIPDFRSITLKLEIIQLFYIGIQTYYANPPGRG